LSVFSDSTFFGVTGVELEERDGVINVPAGVVWLRDCTFRRCHFLYLTIAGTKEVVEMVSTSIPIHSAPIGESEET
jgi:hypothetical protein